VERYGILREEQRVAVAVSGDKDNVSLLRGRCTGTLRLRAPPPFH
jgi:hypothetical protein